MHNLPQRRLTDLNVTNHRRANDAQHLCPKLRVPRDDAIQFRFAVPIEPNPD